MELDEFIRAYRYEGKQGDPVPKPGGKLYFGSAHNLSFYGQTGHEVQTNLPDGFNEEYDWADCSYRMVWTNPDAYAIITYCEGDVSIAVYENEDAYQEAWGECYSFYINDLHSIA